MNRLLAKEDYFSHLSAYLDTETLCTDFGIFKRKIPEKSALRVKFLAVRNFYNKINLKYIAHIEYLDCIDQIDIIDFCDVPNVKTLVMSLLDAYSANVNNLPLNLDLLLIKECRAIDSKRNLNLKNLPCNLKQIIFEYIDDIQKNSLIDKLKNCKFPFDCDIYIGNLQINNALQKK